MARRWNPWRDLRDRKHLLLEWVELDGCAGQIEDRGDHRVIQLDYRLNQIDRNATLCHELVHDERGVFYDDSTPDALIEKEEHAVNHIVAGRLLPPDELAAFVEVHAELEPVTPEIVAVEFGVPVHVAHRGLALLPAKRQAG